MAQKLGPMAGSAGTLRLKRAERDGVNSPNTLVLTSSSGTSLSVFYPPRPRCQSHFVGSTIAQLLHCHEA